LSRYRRNHNARAGKRTIYVVCFVLHFFIVLVVSGRQSASVLLLFHTFPERFESPLTKLEAAATFALGEDLLPSNPVRLGIDAYRQYTGTETGFGFFAPRVAVAHKLVFEIKYADGHVEYELPHVGHRETGLRLFLLLENIARVDYSDLRETMLKMMAFSVWREHRDATLVRAIFGIINLPSVAQFEQGERETYQVLYTYEFRFSSAR
jgi:hypothetical protein